MLSALMTVPPSRSASAIASPDLPLAVGPAIRMARAVGMSLGSIPCSRQPAGDAYASASASG